jgi:hypothetical protein
MNNPNARAAALAGAIAIAAQWLTERYAHVALSDYWKAVITTGATVAILYVGKNGVKAALLRLLNGPKAAWTGTAPPTE